MTQIYMILSSLLWRLFLISSLEALCNKAIFWTFRLISRQCAVAELMFELHAVSVQSFCGWLKIAISLLVPVVGATPGLSEPGGLGGGALTLIVFGRSVNPIWTRGSRLCPPHSYILPPDFHTFLRPCTLLHKCDAFPFHFVPEIALSNAHRIQIYASI